MLKLGATNNVRFVLNTGGQRPNKRDDAGLIGQTGMILSSVPPYGVARRCPPSM